ncbi:MULTISPECIES: four helix bundle protein [Flavobacterium]|jgi:four helix bundle protein|uniref:Four helix bundle protein n=3 Tax=Flavobacterium TaxID=237 RepID=A0A1M7CBD4_9FLAO|nr:MULTISPECIES: four helix bundle protein [Flavobacterium]ABQ04213.1 S23 ribosomal protein [Flavobacterium johnsoniae UW101]KAF2336295.1 four helix bundle protein [Flavobacterium daemonense]MBL0736078.1 four helix bundle protein [Flavobacterium tagetis]MTH15287.1 four helix bundle protein [Flavobacterium sp. LC2016-01]OXG02556.1 four helix bundle protein [Flavobacterium johnsoniae UW101]
MSKFKSFEEINSWQKSRIFNKKIYLITENSNFKKDFDFVRQIRRASLSISSNIAEGFERNTDKEFIYFLYVAKASAGEVRSQLYLAFDLEYIIKEEFEMLLESITEISKLLSGFIKYLSPKS